MNTELIYANTCYVILQIGEIHPAAREMRHQLMWYPERAFTLLDCIQYRPYTNSIVTECPWLISCYDREDVRVWNKEHGWVRPNDQTYGASVNGIRHHILKISQTISSTPLDGGTQIQKLIERLKDERS